MAEPARTYLESLDSVRGVVVDGEADDLVLGYDDLHVFTEALLTLALGRQIVVPQPYALDSSSFLSLAAHVLSARPPKVAGSFVDRPFGWHAHGPGRTGGIDAALAAMIHRNPTSESPFHSSAWPGLNTMSGQARSRLAEDALAGLTSLHPAQGERLAVVLQELRRVRPVEVPAAGASRFTLPDVVDALRYGSSTDVGSGLDDRAADVFDRLSRAARQLIPQGRQLTQRSVLRLEVWPWDPEQRSPVEVVGSAVDFDLFVEFVDTAYNRTIAESIGGIHALFSTAIATDDDRQIARGIAQSLALLVRERGGNNAVDRLGQRGLAFEVRAAAEARESHTKQLARLRGDAQAALTAVMKARSERRSDGGLTPFWSNVQRLDRALASGDEHEVEEALKRHARLLGSVLGDEPRTPHIVMQVASAGGLGGAGAYVGLAFGSALMVASSAVLGAVGVVAPLVPAAAHELARGRRLASAVRGSLRIVEADHG